MEYLVAENYLEGLLNIDKMYLLNAGNPSKTTINLMAY